jgi:hypothetical protein
MNHGLSDILATLFDRAVRAGCVDAPPLIGEPIDLLREDLDAIGFRLDDFRARPRTGRGKARGTRKIENVTGVLYHQTAAIWRDPARWVNVPAHAGVGPDYVVLLHDLQAYMYHAGAANKFTIGIEIMCRADGVEGEPRTFWRSKKEIAAGRAREDLRREASDQQLAAGRALGRYYVLETLRRGGQIVAAMDHRNSAKSRVGDPGSRIHRCCTRALADAYGLQCGEPVVGDGRPNPTAWSGPPGVSYDWRVKGY